MQITFDPTMPEEVRIVLAAVSNGVAISSPVFQTASTHLDPPAGPLASEATIESTAPAKRGRGRPKAADTNAPTNGVYHPAEPGAVAHTNPPVPPTPPAPAGDVLGIDFGDGPTEPTKVVSQDVVVSAVRAYYAKHGKVKTAEMLARFKVTKITDLKSEDYHLVIKAAEQ